ncbi:MAG: CpaD family pilus assembly protein [Hyphomicrobiaceae bacterium]
MRFFNPSGSACRSAVLGLAVTSLLGFALPGCRTLDDHHAYLADATPIDVAQRHPIVVSQQPVTITFNVARGAAGLAPAQRAQLAGLLQRYRGSDAGNSKLLLAVPAGSSNESSVVRAVADMRRIISDFGFADSAVAIQPYHAKRDAAAPIRFAYMRYVAQAPACGIWDTNLAHDRLNVPYTNFGCAQQHNLAMQVANPPPISWGRAPWIRPTPSAAASSSTNTAKGRPPAPREAPTKTCRRNLPTSRGAQ